MTQPVRVSYVNGVSTRPLLYRTVDDVLTSAATRAPDNLAFVFSHPFRRWSFREFDAEVAKVAHGLVSLGLSPGERIAIWAPNCVEWLLTMFAAARAGLILVNINPAYRAAEVDLALRHAGCSALVFAPAFKSSNYLSILGDLIPNMAQTRAGEPVSARFPELRYLVSTGTDESPGCLPFNTLMTKADSTPDSDPTAVAESQDADRPYNIQFTSGTTGAPKGATLTHFNIVNNAFFIGEKMRLTDIDRLCIPVPLYHCFGMVVGVLAAVTHRAACVFPGEGFDAALTLEAVDRERCTGLHGVPTMFIAELDHPRFADFDVASLRTGVIAGAPCPITLMRRIVETMHMREVTICYGMTETGPVSFQSDHDDPLERRVSTVGRIHPHVQVKIVDEMGRVTPIGVPGELLTRGYGVMQGYWNAPDLTAKVIDQAGWMHSGDLATIDEQGYCNIVGRVKDMIIRGGENISPREIEEFLYRHPAVLDVAVIGVPDDKYGEAVCACIKLRDGVSVTEESIRAFCEGHIAHYKIPHYVRFLDTFPMTVTGKIQKYLLREWMRSNLLSVRA